MANIILEKPITPEARLMQMRRDAGFDVADDDRIAEECVPRFTQMVRSSGVPKMFLSNQCSFNCAYCGCRSSRDKPTYCHAPRTLAALAVNEARANKCGVFISSAIYKDADTTQELIVETLRVMRQEMGYTGYIHAKVMPGADPGLIDRTGWLASRMSVNIEVARSQGYGMVAKQKNKTNILEPMRRISDLIAEHAEGPRTPFAVSQTTQLMAGAAGEDDRTIMILSQALYKTYRLKRVYYTPFQYAHPAKGYDLAPVLTPVWRMNRLYQADRLLELYQFTPDELTPSASPFLEEDIDPKAAWALRNMHLFPVEVNSADLEMLLRVPGIGRAGAERIVAARRETTLTHETLRFLHVSLKRSAYFITCNGKFQGGRAAEGLGLRALLAAPEKRPANAPPAGQMSFADLGMSF